MGIVDPADLAAFETGEIRFDRFSHREHVRLGFEMLRRYSFTEAAQRFATALKAVASGAGKQDVYHETITVAFLSLIGERIASERFDSFIDFERCNPDLFRRDLLESRYSPERLASPTARSTFLLPDRA